MEFFWGLTQPKSDSPDQMGSTGAKEHAVEKKIPLSAFRQPFTSPHGIKQGAWFLPCRKSFLSHSLASFPPLFRKTEAVFRDFPGRLQSGRFTGFSWPGWSRKYGNGGQFRPGILWVGEGYIVLSFHGYRIIDLCNSGYRAY